MHRHHNGVKTAVLFGAIWAVLLLIGGCWRPPSARR